MVSPVRCFIHRCDSCIILVTKPVYTETSPLRVKGEVIEKDDRFSRITVKVSIYNKNEEKVCRGIMQIGVLQ